MGLPLALLTSRRALDVAPDRGFALVAYVISLTELVGLLGLVAWNIWRQSGYA